MAALALWNSYVWMEVHTVVDNAYQHVISYVDELPKGSHVAATEETGEFLVKEPAYGRLYKSVEL